jgi:hypothetical protein
MITKVELENKNKNLENQIKKLKLQINGLEAVNNIYVDKLNYYDKYYSNTEEKIIVFMDEQKKKIDWHIARLEKKAANVVTGESK